MTTKKETINSKIGNLLSFRNDFASQLTESLEFIPVKEALFYWSENEENYKPEVNEILKHKLIPESLAGNKSFTVGDFKIISHQSVMIDIKKKGVWSNKKNKKIVACYKAFVKWLNHLSFGWFSSDLPSYQMSLHAMNQTLTFPEWRIFIKALCKNYTRNSLVARCILQGERRISEVLSLTTHNLDFNKNTIKFITKKAVREINYEKGFMRELKEYIDKTDYFRKSSPYIFITLSGKLVSRSLVNLALEKTSKDVGVKKVTPDSLRGMWKIFIQQKYSEPEIMHRELT